MLVLQKSRPVFPIYITRDRLLLLVSSLFSSFLVFTIAFLLPDRFAVTHITRDVIVRMMSYYYLLKYISETGLVLKEKQQVRTS